MPNNHPQDCDISLPGVLMDFFKSGSGHSMVLKGQAGTGKTTLALQLVEALSQDQRTHYVSGRVADAALKAQFPWLALKVRRAEIVRGGRNFLRTVYPEGKSGGSALSSTDTVVKSGIELLSILRKDDRMPESLTRTELKKLEGQIEAGEADEEMVSGNEHRGEFAGDTISFEIGSDLPEVDIAYDAVETALPSRSLIVFDSIDALAEKYGISKTRLVNTVQRDLVEHGRANVLYVLESSGPNPLDYLGDGVVTLSTEGYAGRRIRTMTIDKLRGSSVEHPNLSYSLIGGRVQFFEPRTQPASIPTGGDGRWISLMDPSETSVSTGNPELDGLFGGLAKGSINLIEVGHGVPLDFANLLASTLIANFVTQGRGVAYLPSNRGNAETAWLSLAPFVDQEDYFRHVRVFEINIVGSEARMKNVLLMEGTAMDTDLRWDNIEYNLQQSAKPYLSILSVDMLETIYGENPMEALNNHLFSVRKAGAVFVGLLNESKESHPLVSAANMHLKIERIGPTVVLYGEKPYTALQAVQLDLSRGYPRLAFTPIL
jgi:KaiC/GvpD/RAD55 family RecA-like ATPase